MDIVSAASLTKPASTNHTPGSRADPGSEICRDKVQQCLGALPPPGLRHR
jgi:hypothetical protein